MADAALAGERLGPLSDGAPGSSAGPPNGSPPRGAAPPLAPGVFRRRHRRLFPAEVEPRCGRALPRQSRAPAWALGSPASRMVRTGADLRVCRGLCADAGNRLGARRADAAAPPRARRRHRTRCRHRVCERGWRIIIEADPLPAAGSRGPASPSARAHPAYQRRAESRRPGVCRRCSSGAGTGRAGGRDFQRELYFAGIGAVGYSLARPIGYRAGVAAGE